MDKQNARQFLLDSLKSRYRPETLIESISFLLGNRWTIVEAIQLAKAKPRWRFSSMPDQFAQPAPLTKKAATIDWLDTLSREQPTRTRLVRRVARLQRAYIHEQKEYDQHATVLRLAQFAETAFASRLSGADLFDDDSLAFVAWMTARLGMRSAFTNTSQIGPFDTIANLLLKRCNDGASWPAIARVFPRADVLAHLSEAEKTALLDDATALLQEIASLLQNVATKSKINVRTMIVQSGNDSSTWNALAGAWNKARDFWLAALDALNWLWLLDDYCPGKVMRLMAADVAVWHGGEDDALHPDTKVWRDLPLPWEVLTGIKPCGRKIVEDVCTWHHVDPVKSGWTGVKARTDIEVFRPTPELVYGVTVDHPALATLLRSAGVFSGKKLKLDKFAQSIGAR